MQAIKLAINEWKVDIIAMSWGFDNRDDLLADALEDAKHAKILIFAAASNFGNSEGIAFPASMTRTVMCIFSTSGNGKESNRFNPSGSPKMQKFAVLGEDVVVGYRETGEKVIESGTSIATSIAAGIAGRIIDFSRHQKDDFRPPDITESYRTKLKTLDGMSKIFEYMAKGGQDETYSCVLPWTIAQCLKDSEFGTNDSAALEAAKRKYIWDTIIRALNDKGG